MKALLYPGLYMQKDQGYAEGPGLYLRVRTMLKAIRVVAMLSW